MKKQLIFYINIFVLLIGLSAQSGTKLVILHTNDTHSQLEPTDTNALKDADMGGYARRMGVINQIRQQEELVLLLDAGDFSQGTPYYNFFKGRLEVEGYNMMKYDAVALGNHEFDNGMDTLAAILSLADFPIVVSNYDVSKSSISAFVKPYLVLKRGNIRIGIMGLGVNPAGLIMENNYKGIKYKDPVETAKEISTRLKKREKCDVVICLSHLGSDSTLTGINDFDIARGTRYIDVIIGGHSHTLLENKKINNAEGKNVLIAQMGKSGLYLGRIDLMLTESKSK
ncbi:MAG: metallophosphatase [Paludibacter sp.]|nr:metallophosphatase [Paludibacter sp.]